jgi:hypothetical protein
MKRTFVRFQADFIAYRMSTLLVKEGALSIRPLSIVVEVPCH